MNTLIRASDSCVMFLYEDGWFEILTPGDPTENCKPHIRVLGLEYLGNMEFHTMAVRQAGAMSSISKELFSHVDFVPCARPKPLINVSDDFDWEDD